MHTGPEFIAILFVCVTLGLGSLARFFGKRLLLPYTIVVLLVGLGIGSLLQYPAVLSASGVLGNLRFGAHIAPDLIIFVFLPALVFESAFDLDVHAFKKELGGILIFAIPALLMSTVLVGLWMLWVSSLGWHWSLMSALVFGALISATDPVAVVAILRETTSPKRLGMLIEGESLMNDGTAIVVFSALLAMLASTSGGELDLVEEMTSFAWIVGGGIGVGLCIAWAVSSIISRTFNDAIIEISLTIVAAYGAMLVAEGLLHVSGVMAVVTTGLYLSGPGQTLISPEVRHFLHRFWAMVTHIANTLIFFLVGLIIAAQLHSASLIDYEIILFTFVGVVVLRFAITFTFRPLVGLISAPLGTRETTVMAWGGLRGAVSLALALMCSQHPGLPETLRQQMLLVTAGVVFLTIVINGSTIAWLLGRLGLTSQSTTEKNSNLEVRVKLLQDVEAQVSTIAQNPDMTMVPWKEVYQDLALQRKQLHVEHQQGLAEAKQSDALDRQVALWRKACTIERQIYWKEFASGVLSRESTRILDRSLALQLDCLAAKDVTPPPTRIPKHTSVWQMLLSRLPNKERLTHWQFDHLALLYDVARGQLLASKQVVTQMDQLHEGSQGWSEVRQHYMRFDRLANERLEELRSSLPEVAQAIELRFAKRLRLNIELSSTRKWLEAGVMDPDEALASIAQLESAMKALSRSSKREPLPETAQIVQTVPLFQDLGTEALAALAVATKEMLFTPGETLIAEGDSSDCMYIITRGAAQVRKNIRGKEVLLDSLGGGDIVGEMALLTGEPRNATIVAVTTLTVGKINKTDFDNIIRDFPSLRKTIWTAFSHHRFANQIRHDWRFSHLSHNQVASWWAQGKACDTLSVGDVIDTQLEPGAERAAFLFLVSGRLDSSGSERNAPALLGIDPHQVHRVVAPAHVVKLPALPSELAPR